MPTFPAELLSAGAVTAEYADGLVTVTLADPARRNAQTPATWRALAAIGDALTDDVSVVVLRGAGASFSAGMDRRMFTPEGIPGEPSLATLVAGTDGEGADIIAEFQRAFSWWREVPALTISAVQGHAVGAGFQLALATDLMVVADDVSMVMKEAAFGLVPDLAGTHPLVEAVGYRRALDICVSTRPVGATEAVTSGLAVRSVPAADLSDAVAEVVQQVTGLAPGTAAAIKGLLRGARERTPAEQRRAERETQMGRLRALTALFGA